MSRIGASSKLLQQDAERLLAQRIFFVERYLEAEQHGKPKIKSSKDDGYLLAGSVRGDRQQFDNLDSDIKTIGEAMKVAAVPWANMRDSVRSGAISAELDITPNLLEALRAVRKARRDNESLHAMLSQPDLMTGQTLDPMTARLLRFFYGGEYFTRPVGQQQLAGILTDYAQSAMRLGAQPDLMTGEVVAPQEIVEAILKGADHGRGQEAGQRQAAEGSREPAGGGPARGDPGQARPAEQRPADAGRRGRPGADRGAERAAGGTAAAAGQADTGLTAPPATQAEPFALAQQTEDDVRQQEADRRRQEAEREQEAAEQARRESAPAADDFVLSGSDRPADQAPARGQMGLAPPAPETFVPAPDGSLDYGEITPEMGKAMRRQAGKIRLQRGDAGWGMEHIEARHGNEIRAAGFDGVEAFVSTIATNIDRIIQPDETSQLVVLHSLGNDRVLYVQLRPVRGGSDFYTVRTAFPARAGFAKNREGWKVLWDGRAQPSTASGSQPPFADPPQSAGEAGTIPSGQSTERSVARGEPDVQQSRIDDVGEKIGGARKDLATSTGPRAAKATSDQPGWRNRYSVAQIAKSSKPDEEGRWSITDKRQKDWTGQPKQVGATFATKEEAEAAIPLLEVARNHRASPVSVQKGEPTVYEIVRVVTDRKRVKVVDKQFPTREDALRYMAEHAVEIIETRTSFGEEILPAPDTVRREGPARRQGDATSDQFKETFGFRGVEFGNWNSQEERQAVMNHAFDGLADLAEVLGIPTRAIGLNGELSLAFGARGSGLTGARAHYERDYSVINLTKMHGAGSLAHEWMHALDHYLARQDTKASSERVKNERGDTVFKIGSPESDMVSHGFKSRDSGARQEVRDAYAAIIETMYRKAEQYVEDTQKADRFVAKAREDVQKRLDQLRAYLANKREYGKRNNEPASAEQLAAFDELARKIVDGEMIEMRLVTSESKSRRMAAAVRWSNDALEGLNKILKAVRGHGGFDATTRDGTLDRLRGEINNYSQRLRMLADAQNAEVKTKKVPTDFAMAAKSIDQGRASDYWSTQHEMVARAFQSYVLDKIAERGGASDFLTYGAENLVIPTPWGWQRPFPAGAERKAINAAFDNLVAVLQTKETDTGVALFSRSASTQQAYEARIDALFAGARATPGTRVLDESDVMGLLGFPQAPMVLNESHLRDGIDNHPEMTAATWKKVPQWIESPVVAYEDGGRVVMIGPELAAGYPVRLVIEPNPGSPSRGKGGGKPAESLLVTVFAKTTPPHLPPLTRLSGEGALRYVHTQNAPEIWRSAGAQFPRQSALFSGRGKILTEKNLAGYRRAAMSRGASASGLPAPAVTRIADAVRAAWANPPDVVVVAGMDDPQVPQAVRDYDAEQRSQGATGSPEGFFYDGKVYLDASQLATPADVVRVLAHEALGHYGLRGLFGPKLGAILDQIVAVRRKDVEAKRQEYGLPDTVAGRRVAAEEVLAGMAQTNPQLGFVRRAVAAIRTWLRGLGLNLRMTDADIVAQFILPARQWVERGGKAGTGMPAFSRSEDSRPSAAERREAERQFKDAERAYGGRDAWQRARDAGRTKLGYGQWVQVRTPAFKAWFGDWEMAAATPARQAGTFTQAREAAKVFQGRDLTNVATGLIARVSRNSLDKMLNQKAVGKSESAASHSLAVANLDVLFGNAFLGWSKPDFEGDANIASVHRFFAPLLDGGVPRIAKITVKETSDLATPNRIYSVESVEFNEKSPAARWVAASAAADGIDLTSTRSARDVQSLAQRVQEFNPDTISKVVDANGDPQKKGDPGAYASPRSGVAAVPLGETLLTGVDSFVRRPFDRVNPDTVSKLVDENGEPLVVYHGTQSDKPDGRIVLDFENGDPRKSYAVEVPSPAQIEAFEPRAGDAIWFAQSSRRASDYATHMLGKPGRPAVYPVFLNIKNPRIVDAKGRRFVSPLGAGRGGPGINTIANAARVDGHDGLLVRAVIDPARIGDDEADTTIAVFRPERIKSAIGNVGTFDPENPDIRFSRRAVEQGYITQSRWEELRDGVRREGVDRQGEVDQDERGAAGSAEGDSERLQRFFHGTRDDVTPGFDREHPNRKDLGWLGDGVYVTDDADLAEAYANLKKGSAAPNVLPLAIRIRNPFRATLAEKKAVSRLSKEGVQAFTAELIRKGHDSVVLTYPNGTSEVVVFDPANVRSYHAEFKDGDSTDLLFSRTTLGARPPTKQPPVNRWQATKQRAMDLTNPEALDKLIYELQDKFIDLKRVRDHIKALGGAISDLNDAYLGEELYHKRVAYRTQKFLEDELRPLFAHLRTAGVTMPEFEPCRISLLDRARARQPGPHRERAIRPARRTPRGTRPASAQPRAVCLLPDRGAGAQPHTRFGSASMAPTAPLDGPPVCPDVCAGSWSSRSLPARLRHFQRGNALLEGICFGQLR